jgi:hypothetical protein
MSNDYVPLSVNGDEHTISKVLPNGGTVSLNTATGEYSYSYGPTGGVHVIQLQICLANLRN